MDEYPATTTDITEIFADLRALCLTDGALHQISAIIYRDWVLTVDLKKGRVKDDPAHRWSTSKLNKNELLLLLGLAVQSTDGRTYMVTRSTADFATNADRLLRGLHDAINVELRPSMNPETGEVASSPSLASLAREAIYYGAESFYLHQFAKFAPPRYAADADWLQAHAGATIERFAEIAQFVVDTLTMRMTAVGQHRKKGREFAPHEFTESLIIAKAELFERFGPDALAFIKKFATPAMGCNAEFTSPFSINAVTIAPLIDVGEHVYVPNQYRLLECLYESPFYWMNIDAEYRKIASDHRGAFLERTASSILRSVFGDDNVFENVKLSKGKKVVGEIDVLVVYGEYVLIGQAKSKRVTQKARAGDVDALAVDFKGAIQDPFEQALACAAHMRSGARCLVVKGREVETPNLARVFPTVFLSDPFPALTFLSRALLKRPGAEAPVIWDLAVLDCVARIFPGPVDLLYYLKSRAASFDNMISDSEYNFVGFHLRNKLVLPEEADVIMIDREFATPVDDFMIAADLGVLRSPPKGILQQFEVPFVTALLKELKSAPPQVAAIALDLYDFSSAALESMSSMIKRARKDVKRGKALKAFSLPTTNGGFTYVVVRERNASVFQAARAIAAKRKYDARRDRWYVIVDDINTKNPIDALSPLIYAWREDAGEIENSARVASLFNSRQVVVTSGAGVSSRAMKRKRPMRRRPS